jgi:hypothetical protein
MNASPERAPMFRWILVGAVVPVAFVGVESAMLTWLWPGEEWLTATLAFHVLQVGVLGVLCGRFIDWPPMRWLIYCWCWLSIDVQLLITATLLQGSFSSQFKGDLLFNAMFAAQLSLVTIWGILATSNWLWRMPLAVVLGALVAFPLAGERDFTYFVQMIALGGLCLLLSWRRFRLMRLPQEGAAAPAEAAEELRSVQFGIRHVLIWTTSLALALGVAKAMDRLNVETAHSLVRNDGMALICSGLLAAIGMIAAIWAALGAGPAWMRWPLLVVFAVGGGLAADLLHRWTLYEFVFGVSGRTGFWEFYLEQKHSTFTRYALAASLLFATLLIFRAIGYRLQQAAEPATA